MAKKIQTEEASKESASKNILSDILKKNPDEHYNNQDKVEWTVSTGSLILDAATGGVKPSLWRICGNFNAGKTPSTLEIVRNILIGVPNSKSLWVLGEGRDVSAQNKARCGLKFVYDVDDWDIGTVFVLKSNVYELFIKIVQDLVTNNPESIRYAIVVDSINGLITRKDKEREIEENTQVAGQAVLSKKMFQSLSLGMFLNGHWMGLISQVTSEIKLEMYGPKTPSRGGQFSGGNALLHYSDFILTYEPSYASDFILDNPNGKLNDGKSKPIGQNVKVTLNKSTQEASKKITVSYPVKYFRPISGVWREREVGDSLIMWGLLIKGGAWFTFGEQSLELFKENNLTVPEKIHGVDNVYKMLEENPEVCEFLYQWFAKAMIP